MTITERMGYSPLIIELVTILLYVFCSALQDNLTPVALIQPVNASLKIVRRYGGFFCCFGCMGSFPVPTKSSNFSAPFYRFFGLRRPKSVLSRRHIYRTDGVPPLYIKLKCFVKKSLLGSLISKCGGHVTVLSSMLRHRCT